MTLKKSTVQEWNSGEQFYNLVFANRKEFCITIQILHICCISLCKASAFTILYNRSVQCTKEQVLKNCLIIVAFCFALGIKIFKDGGYIFFIEDAGWYEVFLLDEPYKHQASNQANNTSVYILSVIILCVYITREGDFSFWINSPLIPFEQVVIELLCEQLRIKHLLPFFIQLVKCCTITTLHSLQNVFMPPVRIKAVYIAKQTNLAKFFSLSLFPLLLKLCAFTGANAEIFSLTEYNCHRKVIDQTIKSTSKYG